jgi:transcriptional regulator with XRE-family HTH domain
MDIEQTIASNIKRIRSEKGLTQEMLAQRCGMQISYIGMIEIRKKNPKLCTVQRIAKGLGVHYLELLTPAATCGEDGVSEDAEPLELASREIQNVLQRYFTKSETSIV